MTTLFSRIIAGELPGRFVWRDDRCVAFLSINPLQPGHTLVVPVDEVDQWIHLPVDLAEHLTRVAHVIGRAIDDEFHPTRVGLVVAGFEVPHCHVHVIPTRSMADLNFANAAQDVDPAELDDVADRLRAALRRAGQGAEVPSA
jgi:diadenosine tetraphosphate (Ap4A) HIT family hydrolase